jgi:hypothetical protein
MGESWVANRAQPGRSFQINATFHKAFAHPPCHLEVRHFGPSVQESILIRKRSWGGFDLLQRRDASNMIEKPNHARDFAVTDKVGIGGKPANVNSQPKTWVLI